MDILEKFDIEEFKEKISRFKEALEEAQKALSTAEFLVHFYENQKQDYMEKRIKGIIQKAVEKARLEGSDQTVGKIAELAKEFALGEEKDLFSSKRIGIYLRKMGYILKRKTSGPNKGRYTIEDPGGRYGNR